MRAEPVPASPRSTSARPRRAAPTGSRALRRRRIGVAVCGLVVAGALVGTMAGTGGELFNAGGWPLARRFLAAALRPDLSPRFLVVALRATFTTLGYAVLGTMCSIVIGVVGAVGLSQRWWQREAIGLDRRRRTAGLRWGLVNHAVWAVPRGVHEAVWGLLLISVLGRDPLVAVLAIGIPFWGHHREGMCGADR